MLDELRVKLKEVLGAEWVSVNHSDLLANHHIAQVRWSAGGGGDWIGVPGRTAIEALEHVPFAVFDVFGRDFSEFSILQAAYLHPVFSRFFDPSFVWARVPEKWKQREPQSRLLRRLVNDGNPLDIFASVFSRELRS